MTCCGIFPHVHTSTHTQSDGRTQIHVGIFSKTGSPECTTRVVVGCELALATGWMDGCSILACCLSSLYLYLFLTLRSPAIYLCHCLFRTQGSQLKTRLDTIPLEKNLAWRENERDDWDLDSEDLNARKTTPGPRVTKINNSFSRCLYYTYLHFFFFLQI